MEVYDLFGVDNRLVTCYYGDGIVSPGFWTAGLGVKKPF